MTKSVWVVTYWGQNENPTTTIFTNEEHARKAYEYFSELHENCSIDFCPIYETFTCK